MALSFSLSPVSPFFMFVYFVYFVVEKERLARVSHSFGKISCWLLLAGA
jgi:uncharacterized membrane protein (GlpM family)